MPHTLIIGYGNPLREDDGIGIRAAALLAEELEEDAAPAGGTTGAWGGEPGAVAGYGVVVIACHQLTLELAPQVAAADRVILIDACRSGEPGTLTEQAVTPLLPAQAAAAFTHHLDPTGLLAAAQILYGKAPPTILLTISGSSFGYGEAFSPPVAAALPGLLARVRQLAAGHAA